MSDVEAPLGGLRISASDLGLARYARSDERKSRTDQRCKRETVRLGYIEVPEPHQIAAMSASRWQSARGLMCFSEPSSEDLLLLAGLLLCLLRFFSFLSHLALRYPVGSMQVAIDMHKTKSTPQFKN
jgi:hypothetical protein